MKQSLQARCSRSGPFGPRLRAPCAQQAAEAARLRLSPQGRCGSAQLASRHFTARSGSREAASALLLERVSASEAAVTNEKLRQLRLITAIKTPYLRNGKFDLPAYDAIVELQARPHSPDSIFICTPSLIALSLKGPLFLQICTAHAVTHPSLALTTRCLRTSPASGHL